MKTLLATVLCVIMLPFSAFAQQANEPATKEDVQRLFDITQSRKQIDGFMNVIRQQIPAMNAETIKKQMPDATPEEIATINARTNAMMEKMFNSMPYEEMMQAMMPAYQRHFTHAEVEQIIAFYRSPIGAKMLNEMPALMAEGMQAAMPIMQNWMNSQISELKTSSEEYAKQLKESREKKMQKPIKKS